MILNSEHILLYAVAYKLLDPPELQWLATLAQTQFDNRICHSPHFLPTLHLSLFLHAVSVSDVKMDVLSLPE
jgi:hypothetical protein